MAHGEMESKLYRVWGNRRWGAIECVLLGTGLEALSLGLG